MSCTRRSFIGLMSLAALAPLSACSAVAVDEEATQSNETTATPTGALAFDMTAWNYDSDNDVYWQVGVAYCENPEADEYESLGIYVPGAYLEGSENSDGTYTCTVNTQGACGDFTAETAPVVMPVNTAGYSAQEAPTSYSYSSVSTYLEQGFVYLYAGCRGRSNGEDSSGNVIFAGGAPWGVTDLKAAIRYVRYNAALLPGNYNNMFSFGHSGGGAQSAVLGSSGNSDLYTAYLEAIGAAMQDSEGNDISDEITGAMCWCPITCLDEGDAAYEWMMSQYASSGTRASGTFGAALSQDLAKSFASHINAAGFVNSEGSTLELSESDDGVYASGTYAEYLTSVIEESLNNFLSDTEFPYMPSSSEMADGGFGGGLTSDSGSLSSVSSSLPSGSAPDASLPSESTSGSTTESSTTYETAQDYIDSLNSDEEWISYDASSNTASISSIGAFARVCKTPTKDVCAFDMLDRSSSENDLFGTIGEDSLHFSTMVAELLAANESTYSNLEDWDSTYVEAYSSDLEELDDFSVSMEQRRNMYNPLFYALNSSKGYGSSSVAPYWRIRTGIEQGDTSLTTEMNLSLALQACEGVEDVDFATVWGQGHTTAERTGDSDENFIVWVKECVT